MKIRKFNNCVSLANSGSVGSAFYSMNSSQVIVLYNSYSLN
ncbi:hypothetical protein [Campylobacter sp. W0066.2]|nr:hypothetical protein [Campylobacter sp. W0066.2]